MMTQFRTQQRRVQDVRPVRGGDQDHAGVREEDVSMSQQVSHRSYVSWPRAQQDREAVAREVFGEHVVSSYNGSLSLAARMLFEGYRHKSPTEVQKRFFDWIGGLSEEDKRQAFEFVREMIHGVIFSLLNSFDGTQGSVLQESVWEQLRVVMEIYPRSGDPLADPGEPLEIVAVNSRESREQSGVELHELWFDWLERYSRWRER